MSFLLFIKGIISWFVVIIHKALLGTAKKIAANIRTMYKLKRYEYYEFSGGVFNGSQYIGHALSQELMATYVFQCLEEKQEMSMENLLTWRENVKNQNFLF